MTKEFKEGTFKMGRCTVVVSIDSGYWHLSISTKNCSPSYKEIKQARYTYIPDEVVMAQLFLPKVEAEKQHPFYHHLWQINK